MLRQLKHIRERRADLCRSIDIVSSFEKWEESCVPSYCHRNWLAAYVSWIRLFCAADLAEKYAAAPSRVLDFGSSVGELGHLVACAGTRYEFIEQDQQSVDYLISRILSAMRQTLEGAPDGAYDQVFAIDSLEHNANYGELLAKLVRKLSPRGVLVLSGPTENWLYRIGRAVAGYTGHYHETNIHAIELAAGTLLRRVALRTIMPGLPLFRISAWRLPSAD